ncbi:MAG: SEC-C metal-binding domain-containing protein [Peptostreptococcaceae bacterium]|jgi:uncharacterized protein YecA (UPF0149 family)|nr:SEC-C metal-binding domain-containing protein [Peptostreptococcaceae bacterium]
MSLFEKWNEKMSTEDRAKLEEIWNDYLPKERDIYNEMLESKNNVIKGSIKDLATKYEMDFVDFVGFIDGANTSLVNEVELEELNEESEVSLEFDFEKLYYNMLDAQANWLYDLEAWNDILTVEKRKEIKKEYNKTRTVVKEDKIGRNDSCPCGSGKKYKKCCMNK